MALVIKRPRRVRLGCREVFFLGVVRKPYPRVIFTFCVIVGSEPGSVQLIFTPKFTLRSDDSKNFVGLGIYFCKVRHSIYLREISYYDDSRATRF